MPGDGEVALLPCGSTVLFNLKYILSTAIVTQIDIKTLESTEFVTCAYNFTYSDM